MSTYDFDKVLSDYEHGRITVEMAMGHSLQHIGKLYEAIKANRQENQTKTAALDKRVDLLQAIIDKARAKQKSQPVPSQPKPDQP